MGSPSSSSSTLTSTSSPVLNGLDDRLLLARDDVGRRTRNDDDVDSKGMWDNHDADDLRQGAGADIGYDGYLDERVYAQRASRNDNKTTLRITKGKAKAREQDYGEDHAFSSASSEERPEFPPEAGDEDEREAKRIADVSRQPDQAHQVCTVPLTSDRGPSAELGSLVSSRSHPAQDPAQERASTRRLADGSTTAVSVHSRSQIFCANQSRFQAGLSSE